MKDISDFISGLTNKLKDVNSTCQKIHDDLNKIKTYNDASISKVTDITKNSIQSIFTSNINSSPINISLVSFTSNEERKSISYSSLLKSKLNPNFNSPSYPQDTNGFYQIRGKTANFTFLSHHVERISYVVIDQIKSNSCGIKTFQIICADHKNIFTSEIFTAQKFSEKPQTFYLNRTFWFKSMILNVIENFGDDYICLPNVHVFDNDFYSDK